MIRFPDAFKIKRNLFAKPMSPLAKTRPPIVAPVAPAAEPAEDTPSIKKLLTRSIPPVIETAPILAALKASPTPPPVLKASPIPPPALKASPVSPAPQSASKAPVPVSPKVPYLTQLSQDEVNFLFLLPPQIFEWLDRASPADYDMFWAEAHAVMAKKGLGGGYRERRQKKKLEKEKQRQKVANETTAQPETDSKEAKSATQAAIKTETTTPAKAETEPATSAPHFVHPVLKFVNPTRSYNQRKSKFKKLQKKTSGMERPEMCFFCEAEQVYNTHFWPR